LDKNGKPLSGLLNQILCSRTPAPAPEPKPPAPKPKPKPPVVPAPQPEPRNYKKISNCKKQKNHQKVVKNKINLIFKNHLWGGKNENKKIYFLNYPCNRERKKIQIYIF
jgi:hypothetical protein